MSKQLVSVRYVAAALKTCSSKVDDMVKRGQLKAGPRGLIEASSVTAYLRSSERADTQVCCAGRADLACDACKARRLRADSVELHIDGMRFG
jgi:hypothetical protein